MAVLNLEHLQLTFYILTEAQFAFFSLHHAPWHLLRPGVASVTLSGNSELWKTDK